MFEDSITDEIKSKYILLELDTFHFSDINSNKTAYCLIESTPIQEMFTLDKNLELHKNLVKNYKLRNWKYCEDALEHLLGKWNGEIDSFYNTIVERIQQFKIQNLDSNWTSVIPRQLSVVSYKE
jgi:hypothetical protein